MTIRRFFFRGAGNLRRRASVVTIVLLAACGDDTGGPPTSQVQRVSVDPSWVTGDAAAAVTGGFFATTEPSAHAYPQLSVAAAVRTANAWIRRDGHHFSSLVSNDRGERIDVPSLSACPFGHGYADTPYADVAAEVVQPVRRAYGPYWIVRLCTSALQDVATLAVSAYIAELRDSSTLTREQALQQGNEFFVAGVPSKWREYPMSSELAVREVVNAAGARVSMPPLLVRQANPNAPQAALWRVVVERPVTARISNSALGSRQTSEVFVGTGGDGNVALYVASDEQDGVQRVQSMPPATLRQRIAGKTVQRNALATYEISRREGFALSYAPVTLSP